MKGMHLPRPMHRGLPVRPFALRTCIVLAYPDKAWTARWLSICTIGVLEPTI